MSSVIKVWENRIIHNAIQSEMITNILRQNGLPLAASISTSDSQDSESDFSEDSKIICVLEVNQNYLKAMIVTPSAIVVTVFSNIDETLERDFWRFALKNYYVVTGCNFDKKVISQMFDMEVKLIKGKSVSRKKKDSPSGLTLNQILYSLGLAAK